MKICFKNKNFRQESLDLIYFCNNILEQYMHDGYDLTVRQLYYQLVARDLIENTQASYSRIASLINDGRMAGLIDWDHIVDRGRSTIKNPHWETPREILWSTIRQFRIEKWRKQPVRIEVMCEKQALEGVLSPACSELDIPFTSNKGYASQSLLYNKGKMIHEMFQECEDLCEYVILYFGDHDPSGLDMDRDLSMRLRLFSASNVNVKRVALTYDQIYELNPPPNPAKTTDSRANDYIKKYGNESWELDAIEPRMLVSLLNMSVNSIIRENYIDFTETEDLEERMKDELKHLYQISREDWSL